MMLVFLGEKPHPGLDCFCADFGRTGMNGNEAYLVMPKDWWELDFSVSRCYTITALRNLRNATCVMR